MKLVCASVCRGCSVPSSHAADEPTDAEREHGCRVWAFFDRLSDIILSVDCAAAQRAGRVCRRVFGLPVELLRRAGDLVDDAFSLRACIAGDATEALLRLPAEISCRADDAIFVHVSTSLRICYERWFRRAGRRLVCRQRR